MMSSWVQSIDYILGIHHSTYDNTFCKRPKKRAYLAYWWSLSFHKNFIKNIRFFVFCWVFQSTLCTLLVATLVPKIEQENQFHLFKIWLWQGYGINFLVHKSQLAFTGISKGNIKAIWNICTRLTIKTSVQHHWRRLMLFWCCAGVFFIDFEQIP